MKHRDAILFAAVLLTGIALSAWWAYVPPPPKIAGDDPCAEWINAHAVGGESMEYLTTEYDKCVRYWIEQYKAEAE